MLLRIIDDKSIKIFSGHDDFVCQLRLMGGEYAVLDKEGFVQGLLSVHTSLKGILGFIDRKFGSKVDLDPASE